MTSPTHRNFAIVGACVGTIALQELNMNPVAHKDYELLAYGTMFLINYVFGVEGAKYSDLDHLWKNIKEKTALNKIINSILRLTGFGHRNPVTHSFDIWLVSYILLIASAKRLITYTVLSKTIVMIITAFWIGYLTHLLADALSMDGTRIFFWNSKWKLRFVPKSGKIDKTIPSTMLFLTIVLTVIAWQFISIVMSLEIAIVGILLTYFVFNISNISFKTGIDENDPNNWERMVYNVTYKMTWVGLVAVALYGLLLARPDIKNSINISINLPTLKDVFNGIADNLTKLGTMNFN